MKVKIKDKEYDFSEQELDSLKRELRPYKLEYKSVGFEDVAVYAGLMLIGYAQGKVIDRILAELKK